MLFAQQGMAYLHSSPIQSHGRLRSGCCLIDSRWQLKITSYGLSAFRKDEPSKEDIGEYQEYKAMLWTAPELLRQQKTKPYNGTQKGDVFSFGIILQEILYRCMPYFMDLETPKGDAMEMMVEI